VEVESPIETIGRRGRICVGICAGGHICDPTITEGLLEEEEESPMELSEAEVDSPMEISEAEVESSMEG
jgi:hypothetical protein